MHASSSHETSAALPLPSHIPTMLSSLSIIGSELISLWTLHWRDFLPYLILYSVLSHLVDALLPTAWVDALGRKDKDKPQEGKALQRWRRSKTVVARTRIVSTFMAIHVAVLSLYGLTLGPAIGSFTAGTPLTTHLVHVAVGFFFWDVLYCWDQGVLFLVHGLACVAVFSGALRPFLHHMALVTLLFEASTPFLHARKTLIDCDMAQGWMFDIAQYGFVATFFLSRIAHGLWACTIWWLGVEGALRDGSLEPSREPMVRMYQCLCLLLCGLNCYWFYLIGAAVVGVGGKRKGEGGESRKGGSKRRD
jgi:hypothetical protein